MKAPPEEGVAVEPAEPLGAPVGVFGRALLDALPARTAIVDQRGCVVVANRYWTASDWPEGLPDLDGRDLVAALKATLGPEPLRQAAHQLAEGIELVLAGIAPAWERVTDGASSDAESWHTMQVLPLDVPLGGVVVMITEITDQVRAERRLAWQATHDPLTGLGNRVLLLDRLQQALRRGPVAVLLTDLDRFKVLCDSLGHDVGDRLLQELGGRLAKLAGPGITVARLGGNSFGVVVEDADWQRTERLAAKLDSTVRRPFTLAHREVVITTSTGAVVAGAPESPAMRRGEDLLREAEIAMYQAKDGGRARFVTVEHVPIVPRPDTLDTEQDLRRALERGELRLEYQPEVSIDSGQVLGAEALLRWDHPTRGLLVPNDFLDLAEETGLIVPIGHWTVQQACRDAARWLAADGDEHELFVGVNLSSRQISDPELFDVVESALADSGLPPTRLCVEITENALFDDFDESVAALRALRARGIRIALDDFGTGYSSLSYLKELPVDILKIDRSFVDRLDRDPRDQAVVAAVVTLARVFGMQVVAEGVEGADQLARLRSLGVHVAQGFDVARPGDADTVATLAREGLPGAS